MIYDVIIGKTLPTKYDYNYIRGDYVNRLELNEITEYSDLVDLLTTSLKEFTNQSSEPADEILNIIAEFAILQDDLKNGTTAAEGVDETIRQLLSTLAFIGIDVYVIRRPDLDSDELNDDNSRAYMIDKHDNYFPSINRVVTGRAAVFNETINANIATVIMEFLNDLRFKDIVEDTIELENYRESFEALNKANMGWTLPVDELISFLTDYGYKFVVVV